ncbi:Sensory transduction histidine kinase [Methanosarcina siciliae T4/M]|uniref:Sensory transduction histidine kinase n=3 Tax=Methanosarcina siciliae TaxID=38027 RepID=A0A0E3LB11_9EURY|nr:PAS domain S-box protein [Methanosarcina siciliae]AKB28891.1 Sensory transduction histidine kinase [Methanosarcina siciliae T4/M]AKB32961.1 Sensory transduction histidine kinase [Methanosarcina siciliae HI350]
MNILNKMLLSFVLIVLLSGIILTFAASLDSERELKNINSLYEERGLSIAKTIDASIMSDTQLHNDSQTIVDRLMGSNLDVTMINIHGKAPEEIKIPGYWRGYWILASSNKSNVHMPSKAINIVAMNTNKYILSSYNENGKPIIDVTYPLHDPGGKNIGAVEIKYDMSAMQSQLLMKKTNNMQIALILTLLAIIATILRHKETLNDLENSVKERTSKLETAFDSLKESEKSLAEAQKMAHIGNWHYDIQTNKLYWSDEMYSIFGLNPKELEITYDLFLTYVHSNDRDYVNDSVKNLLNGETSDIDFRIITSDGSERVVYGNTEVIFNESNIPIRLKGTIQDITEHKKAEEKIRILADVVESSNDAIVTESLEDIITSWNEGAEQIYGYSSEEILGKNGSILEPDNLKGEINQFIGKIQQEEKIKNYETLGLRKDGKIINVSLTLSPVFDVNGKMTAISVIARDVTKRKEAEEALAKTEIARKQEIHHRIKNNLQVISSLLDLQAEKFKSKKDIKYSEVLEAFKESQDRVISMALIHEELYKGGEIETLNFSPYIEELADNLFQTYSLGSTCISLKLDLAENVYFDMDTAVPLGIIVNELVTNSLKHAFSGRNEGKIQIKLVREKNGERTKSANIDCKSTGFALTVSDNGVGIPENLDIEDLNSLGFQLVTSLVDQLDGEFELKRSKGTEFTVRFIVTEKDNPAS